MSEQRSFSKAVGRQQNMLAKQLYQGTVEQLRDEEFLDNRDRTEKAQHNAAKRHLRAQLQMQEDFNSKRRAAIKSKNQLEHSLQWRRQRDSALLQESQYTAHGGGRGGAGGGGGGGGGLSPLGFQPGAMPDVASLVEQEKARIRNMGGGGGFQWPHGQHADGGSDVSMGSPVQLHPLDRDGSPAGSLSPENSAYIDEETPVVGLSRPHGLLTGLQHNITSTVGMGATAQVAPR
jgi:hypothetical protein